MHYFFVYVNLRSVESLSFFCNYFVWWILLLDAKKAALLGGFLVLFSCTISVRDFGTDTLTSQREILAQVKVED